MRGEKQIDVEIYQGTEKIFAVSDFFSQVCGEINKRMKVTFH